MVSTVYAPDVATYAARSPYLTRQEFREAGTGADTANLVPGNSATQADKDAALDRVIARASSWADTFCNKILAATTDVTAGSVRIQNDGSLALAVPYTPIFAVTGVKLGVTPYQLTAMGDLSTVWIDGSIIRVAAWSDAATGTHGAGFRSGYRYMAVTYVNGWANARLTATANIGATSIVVDTPLGFYPGMTMSLDDGGESEQATIAASYTPGVATIPLTAGLANLHAAGVGATMLPQAIKQAVILYTAALIRTRGSSAIVMGDTGAKPEVSTSSLPGGSREQQLAEALLSPFRRAV